MHPEPPKGTRPAHKPPGKPVVWDGWRAWTVQKEPRIRRVRVHVSTVLLGLLLLASGARAQTNPVFLDDSTLAADVLAGLPGLLASDNPGEAVRLLQRLLDDEGDRLIETTNDPDLLESVRARVHRVLLQDSALLARYRTVETETAALLLEAGRAEEVERTRLLTAPGFEAVLRVAADHLASGRFESARLALLQLETHPDRHDPVLAARTAALWAQLAAYLDREDIHAAARRWADSLGLHYTPPTPVEWPRALLTPAISPMSAGSLPDLTELVETPLCSADLRPVGGKGANNSTTIEQPLPSSRRSRTALELPYIFPLVVGDTIYTTDGLWINAWDRLTLTPRWRTKPRGADNEREALEEQYAAAIYRQNRSRDVEEATTLALHGRVLLAATGLVADGSRRGDPRLHALDARTGRVLWSAYIDELDPELDEGSSRGPALFEGDLAIVAVRKTSKAKRYASAYLVGIDLADGSARWVRLAGSAGWLAYGGRGLWTDWPTIHRGIVYSVDKLGVICALEAGTGRYRWVRRLPGVEGRIPGSPPPWTASTPVIDGNTLLTLSPDRRELLRLDLATGEILSRRDTKPLGSPGYIFPHRDRLIAVSLRRVATLPIADAETAPARVSSVVADPGIVGRVVAAGNSLLLPLATGFGVVNLDTLKAEHGIELSAPGNLVPLDQQLLTADNEQLHSYLVWEDAAEVLRARLEADPTNAATAISFAELAHRAGHPEAVLAPIDHALSAMATDPLSPTIRPGQERLFALLLEMLRNAEANRNAPPDAPPEAPLPPKMLDALAERMGLVAVTPDERATHLLVRSRLHETIGRIEQAVADCQTILTEPQLAGASWSLGPSSVRAEIDALARLDRLLGRFGREPYAPFEAIAAEQLAQLRATDAEAAAYESLARAYPRSAVAPAAWLAAAEHHAGQGSALALDRALARGIQSAAANSATSLPPDPALIGELLGRRLSTLLAANRLDTAAALLSRSRTDWPGVLLTASGVPLDPAALAATLRERVGIRTLRPRIGPGLVGTGTELPGWVLMRPLDRRDAQARRPGLMLLTAGQIGLWQFDQNTQRLAPLWTAPSTTKPTLVRFDPDRVLLLEPDEQGGSLLALDPADGRVLWQSDPLGETLARAHGSASPPGQESFDAPLDGEVAAGDLLLALDETTIAVVSRSGRAAGIDLASGQVVWARRTGCRRVNDAAAGDGVLVLGGTSAPASNDIAGEPTVLVLDLASGEEISRYAPATGPAAGRVRWVHLTPGTGRVVVGLSRGLVGLALPLAQPDWTLADLPVEQTTGAWGVGTRLFVQSSMRELALVDAVTGELRNPRLDTAGALELGEPIDAVHEADRFVLLSPAGCAMLDATTGELLAADAIDPIAGGMVQPALAADHLVLAEREPIPGQIGLYRLHILDAATARALSTVTLALTDRPRRVAVLDGAILITAGDRTIVLPTE
ncbi:hypothetical protein MNBD_PLANCTO03-2300 [hydrothermal vent metagenome]|uniref:Pyrrolo-quinoline quinone repeat domain-containing protein n=1 Tax=hydrothermal vent metagenome TaxID=652676 RepID=A0A3B1DK56_9ZZZZ